MGKNTNRVDALIQGVLDESLGGRIGQVVVAVKRFVNKNVQDYKDKSGGVRLFPKREPIKPRIQGPTVKVAAPGVSSNYKDSNRVGVDVNDKQTDWASSQPERTFPEPRPQREPRTRPSTAVGSEYQKSLQAGKASQDQQAAWVASHAPPTPSRRGRR